MQNHLSSVRTVVVPAAGMGTRFLPATKTVPKELLPVVDTPGIEMIAEEAAAAGASRLAIVTSPSKDEVMRHFDEFPDDVIEPTAAMSEMIRVRQEHGGSVLLAVEVDPSHVSNYGVFDIERTENDRVKKVVGMVEKPAAEDAPSNLVATGRYLLDRDIFDALRRINPGKGGELQLTDAIDLLISEGHPVHVVVHDGIRHDLGNPAGFIPASVEFGLRHPKYGPALFGDLEALLEKYRPELG